MGGINPTAHDISVQIFVKISKKEILPNFIIGSSETLMRSHKTRVIQLKYAVTQFEWNAECQFVFYSFGSFNCKMK